MVGRNTSPCVLSDGTVVDDVLGTQRREQETNDTLGQEEAEEVFFDSEAAVRVGTHVIEVVEDDKVLEEEQGPLYLKELRDALLPEKQNELFSQAVKQSQTKYDFTSVKLSNEKRLDKLYNISNMIAKTKAVHLQYDLHNVFTIVYPIATGGKSLEAKTVDLYSQYDQVTVDEVADSCEWYRKWTKKDYYWDNLIITFCHLENNMTHKLFDKVFERYESYPESKKGGPLLFIIMMKLLVSNSQVSQGVQ